MRLTTTSLYAITAMVDLALHQKYGPVTVGELSRRVDLSLSSLQLILGKLRQSGFIEGTRGPGGGYKLICSPEKTTVADIVSTVKSVHLTGRLGKDEKGQQTGANTLRIVQGLCAELDKTAMAYLASVTLHDLVNDATASNNDASASASSDTEEAGAATVD